MDDDKYNDTNFTTALDKVITRRLEAKKKYGDKWLLDPIEDLELLIFMKCKRVKDALSKDAYEDSLLDLIIYSLFVYDRQLRGIGKYKK